MLEPKAVTPAGSLHNKSTNDRHCPQHREHGLDQSPQGEDKKRKKWVEENKENDRKQTKDSKTRGDSYDRCDESIRHEIKSRQVTEATAKQTQGKHPYGGEQQKRKPVKWTFSSDVASLILVNVSLNRAVTSCLSWQPCFVLSGDSLSVLSNVQVMTTTGIPPDCVRSSLFVEFNTPVSKILRQTWLLQINQHFMKNSMLPSHKNIQFEPKYITGLRFRADTV